MKTRLLSWLVCPTDRGPLELVEWESSSVKLSKHDMDRAENLGIKPDLISKEIVTGVLLNRRRRIYYPIYQGIPRMLVFPTSVVQKFAVEHADRIARELPGFSTPQERGMPGEQSVLRTFSSEWVDYDWTGYSYWNLAPDDVYKCMNFMLDLMHKPVKDKLVLEVGIGVGANANHLADEQQCELVGIDLSYSVDPAYKHFGRNRFFHIVQASIFALPFHENTFDLVYSHGVLHHSFSTKIAFNRISKLPKPGGRLYVWVYSPQSEQRNLIRRILMLMENLIRPICGRLPETLQTVILLPIIPLYLIHQNIYARRHNSAYIKYGWREALHSARDRFTPRYAHRHTEEEVCRWFDEAGYIEIQCARNRERPDFAPLSLFVLATAVDGERRFA